MSDTKVYLLDGGTLAHALTGRISV